MNELIKFYQSLMQEVIAMQSGDEDGDTQEQVFTRICQEMLAEAGETEDTHLAYDERDFGRKGQHKINGYAISENYENVDLFISLYSFKIDDSAHCEAVLGKYVFHDAVVAVRIYTDYLVPTFGYMIECPIKHSFPEVSARD